MMRIAEIVEIANWRELRRAQSGQMQDTGLLSPVNRVGSPPLELVIASRPKAWDPDPEVGIGADGEGQMRIAEIANWREMPSAALARV
jgi:hypothetical protein